MNVTKEFASHELGSVIKAARLDKHFTREQLADKLDIGYRHLMGIENRHKTPGFDLLFRLVRELEIPGDKIFYPEMGGDPSEAEPLVRTIYRCGSKEINAVKALLDVLLKEKGE